MDPKVLALAAGALGFLYVFAVEPLDPSKKRAKDYNPEPYFFQWKARFDEGWAGGRRRASEGRACQRRTHCQLLYRSPEELNGAARRAAIDSVTVVVVASALG
eukprot:CAMPEP_0179257328 /NCGR_PEP_ID=MMETSP0797-20121207/24731_1 /TAXON_ID=47934 /ORGANISM="Dinophysis acuminata, Strain DAEP01" /LENGTH=102 /DNA_ID=CAMNT_0020965301 /DNA_START=75 /DNA_END=381 /DNA_ORIENTATION=-